MSNVERASAPGWAVLIGVKNPNDGQFQPLDCPTRDAIGVYAFLTHQLHTNLDKDCACLLVDGTTESASDDARKTLRGLRTRFKLDRPGTPRALVSRRAEPRRHVILGEMRRAAHNVSDEGLLFVFFAGHALAFDGDIFLLPSEADNRDLPNTSISLSWLKRTMAESRAKHKVLVIDACYAGSTTRPPRHLHDSLIADSRLAVFASCLPTEQAFEEDGSVHSAFSEALLEAWSGKADATGHALVTLENLSRFVIDQVQRWSARTRRLLGGRLQTPALNPVAQRRGQEIVLSGQRKEIHSAGNDRSRSPLVLRQADVDRLHAAFDGGTQAVLLQGEPGCGKSVLALEFADDWSRSGPVVKLDLRHPRPHSLASTHSALDRIRRQLTRQVDAIRTSTPETSGERRLLVLLDNVDSIESLVAVEEHLAEGGISPEFKVYALATSCLLCLSGRTHFTLMKLGNLSADAVEDWFETSLADRALRRARDYALQLSARFEYSPSVVSEIGSSMVRNVVSGSGRVPGLDSRLPLSVARARRAIQVLSPTDRRLLVAMAVCAPREFELRLARRVAGLQIGSSFDDRVRQLVDHSLVMVVDCERQTFRLPPLVRFALQGDPTAEALRRRHALTLKRLFSKPSSRSRHLLHEASSALYWLGSRGRSSEARTLFHRAMESMSKLKRVEHQVLRELRQLSGSSTQSTIAPDQRLLAHRVLSRHLRALALRHQLSGDFEASVRVLEHAEKTSEAALDRWLQQECCGALTRLAVEVAGCPKDGVDWLHKRERICRGEGFQEELLECLGDRTILAFIDDRSNHSDGQTRRSRSQWLLDDEELQHAAVLLEEQAALAAVLGRRGWLPSMAGNLAAFDAALSYWRSDRHGSWHGRSSREGAGPGRPHARTGVVNSATGSYGVVRGALLAVLSVLIQIGGRWRSSGRIMEGIGAVVNEPGAAPNLPPNIGHTSRKSNGRSSESERIYWDHEDASGGRPASVPGTRLNEVAERLLSNWAESRIGAEMCREIERKLKEDSLTGQELGDATEMLVAILRARREHNKALRLLREQETISKDRGDEWAVMGSLESQRVVMSAVIRRLTERPSRVASSAKKDLSRRRRELVAEHDRLEAALDGVRAQLTLQTAVAHHSWAWGLMAGCIRDLPGAERLLQRAGDVFTELRLDGNATAARADRGTLDALTNLLSRPGAVAQGSPRANAATGDRT